MIQRARVRPLNNDLERRGDFVLYWMQAAQRAEDNHALEYAIDLANERGLPLVAFFGLTESFPEAFRLALHLNNKYALDGRDPNSFAGVAWCFGRHGRGWPSRPVFGKVRSMTAAGLRRKFDVEAYVRRYEVDHGKIR